MPCVEEAGQTSSASQANDDSAEKKGRRGCQGGGGTFQGLAHDRPTRILMARHLPWTSTFPMTGAWPTHPRTDGTSPTVDVGHSNVWSVAHLPRH